MIKKFESVDCPIVTDPEVSTCVIASTPVPFHATICGLWAVFEPLDLVFTAQSRLAGLFPAPFSAVQVGTLAQRIPLVTVSLRALLPWQTALAFVISFLCVHRLCRDNIHNLCRSTSISSVEMIKLLRFVCVCFLCSCMDGSSSWTTWAEST